jgi:pyrophosphatase PpaX
MRLRGVIFDLDGTLGDTLPVCYAAYREVFRRFLGRTYSDAEIHALFGPDEEGIFRQLMPDRWADGLRAYLEAYERVHPRLGRPILGVEAVLQFLQGRGVRMGVVTGKGLESTRVSLRLLGLKDYFDVIEPGSAAGAVKPEALGRILHRWGLRPEQVVYVGDSTYDMRASRQAGVRAIAAGWAPTADREALRGEGPALVFDDVTAFHRWLEASLADGEATSIQQEAASGG